MSESVFRVLIVDSATGKYRMQHAYGYFVVQLSPLLMCSGLFRVDFTGRGELAERQQKLGQMMSALQKMGEEFNVAVVITNQV